MIRALALLLALPLLAGCFNDDSEEVAALEGTVSIQDSIIAAQRAALAELEAAFDTARTVAADSALAHLDDVGPDVGPAPGETYADASRPANMPPASGPAPRPSASDRPASDRPARAQEAPDQGAATGGLPDRAALAYDTYRNDRFGFTLDYPYTLLQPDEALGDGHGQSFASPDGSATLVVYGTEEGGADALREEYDAELARGDLRVTYRVLRPDWFVVSGYQGPYIFYQRTHRTGGGLRTFRLRHRAADKDYFDPVVTRLSRSFAG